MTTPIENTVGALWSTIRLAAGVDVTYSQGATSITAVGIPGSSPIVSETADGAIATSKSQDFLFKAVDLLGVVPRRGDTVTWGTRTFEVVAQDGDRQYYYSDPYQTIIRVHCKERA
jgi:hypothetical protein